MDTIIPLDEQNNSLSIKDYFKHLRAKYRFGLLLAFLIPLLVLSGYFHFQFHFSMRENSKLNLAAIAESQRNTVDLFLQERVVNILSLFHSPEFSLKPTSRHMEAFLKSLRQVSDAFIDVGFLDAKGFQVGYAGPFPYLQNKDYSKQEWFVTLLEQEKNHYISDIYKGFRNKLHFTIAVKQIIDGSTCVLRSTLDPEKFYLFLRTINHLDGAESFIINPSGQYQVVDTAKRISISTGGYIPPPTSNSGTREIREKGDSFLVGYAWLSELKWILTVQAPLSIAYAKFYLARRVMIISSAIFIMLGIATIWISTRILTTKAEENAEKREELYLQLLHASKLASLGQLATGAAHEINNPLAIIIATTGVIKDMLNPEFGLENSPDLILKEIETIDEAVFRARDITRQLLNYGRKTNPQVKSVNINDILDAVLSGFKEREFALSEIEIKRDYAADLPSILTDPNQIQQVFHNLINNAGDAITGPGTISVSSRKNTKSIRIVISDTGIGMDSEQIKKVFDPFFTTKEVGKGTGLGLSVSLGIIESLGGTIEVQSMPGAGSAFTVVLPLATDKEKTFDESAQQQE